MVGNLHKSLCMVWRSQKHQDGHTNRGRLLIGKINEVGGYAPACTNAYSGAINLFLDEPIVLPLSVTDFRNALCLSYHFQITKVRFESP